MAPKETENNAYAKCWGDKQRALWYVMVFSGVVNYQTYVQLKSKIQHRQTTIGRGSIIIMDKYFGTWHYEKYCELICSTA